MADGDAGVLPRLIGSVARLRFRANTAGTDTGARQRVNFLDSATVTWVLADSSTNEEVTVTATGAAGYTLPAGVPLGTLGYASTTTAQTGIGATITDLTNLSVTITAGTSRRIKVTGWVPVIQKTATSIVGFYLYEATTELNTINVTLTGADSYGLGHLVTILTPSAGSHTYKLRLNTASGGTTVQTIFPDGVGPAFILVEDCGV